jgi:phenylalanyl-tRNA synthetase beta chain
MKLPYGWLKELVEFPWTPEELAERLTLAGAEAEVEKLTDISPDKIIIGQVVEVEPIKGSDHLTRTVVSIGHEKLPVVCGAPNVAVDQKVILARVGAVLKGDFKIGKAKLRGVESFGMICSERELGISDDHSGIMVLDNDAPIGEPAIKTLGLDDPIIKLDLTPNRADLLSAIGVARDIGCLVDKKYNRPEIKLDETLEKASDYVKVSIDDSQACPRYAARIIKNVKTGPSPWWLRRRLLLSGFRPISNVVDITNLVMMELGHPLHAFDYDRFERKEILVRRAKDKEKFATLDGKEHVLNNQVLLITDGHKAVAAAGVMGGLDSEVSDETKNILLESAYFNPADIRLSRQKLGMVSESSTRFEKGADPNMVDIAIDRAASLLAELAGGEVLEGIVDCYPNKIESVKISLRPNRVNALLGTNISKERMIKILRGIEFTVEDKEALDVTVPTFATDITREADLVEEIVRLEGYDSVPVSDENKGPLCNDYPADDQFRDDVRRILASQGFDEIYSPGMADPGLLRKINPDRQFIKVLNPIAEDLTVMENSILNSMLKSLSHNIAHRNIDLKLFAIGRIYLPGDPPIERDEIAIAVSGHSDNNWYAENRRFGFHDVKGAIDTLCDSFRITGMKSQAEPVSYLNDNCSYKLLDNNESIGYIGSIRDKVSRLFDIKQEIFMAVLESDKLYAKWNPETVFDSLPRYPAAPRDLAVIIDENIRAGDMLEVIEKEGGPILESVRLFDQFRGGQIGNGKKSLAFAMIYRSRDRSLENEEISRVHNHIADCLKKKFGASIRET